MIIKFRELRLGFKFKIGNKNSDETNSCTIGATARNHFSLLFQLE